MRRRPGYFWRTLAWKNNRHDAVEQKFQPKDKVVFDELVIDDWFHLEQMSDRRYWMAVGDWHINVYIPSRGAPEVMMYENK